MYRITMTLMDTPDQPTLHPDVDDVLSEVQAILMASLRPGDTILIEHLEDDDDPINYQIPGGS